MRTFLLAIAAWLLTAKPVEAQKSKAANPGTLEQRAAKIMLPMLEIESEALRNGTLKEALEFLAKRSRELDPAGKGINVILKLPHAPAPPGPPAPEILGPPAPDRQRTGVPLLNVPLSEAFKFVANLSNYHLRWDEHAVVFVPLEPDEKDPPKASPRPAVKVGAGKTNQAFWAGLNRLPVRLPKVEFRDTSLREAANFLLQRSHSIGKEPAPFNMVLKFPETGEAESLPITMSAKDLPLIEAYRYVAELSGFEMAVENFTVYLVPPRAK
jgi:hypothetical protein